MQEIEVENRVWEIVGVNIGFEGEISWRLMVLTLILYVRIDMEIFSVNIDFVGENRLWRL